jgi:two-component system response regulator (stage 0 sporulation protein F)
MQANMNEEKAQPRQKHRILVVDDQVGIVSFLYDFFTHKDYDVLQATSGRKAVQMVQKESPDLVLLDIKLGWGRDGIQVLKEIKEFAPSVRVIMMTGVADDDVVEEAFNLGADDYIIKPFSLGYLEKIVMLKILNLEIKRLGEGGNEV